MVILDQAGWHASAALAVPVNITLLPLPPKCSELNPVENVWQFLRDNWLSNTIFTSCDDMSISAATPGTPSSSNHPGSPPSNCANRHMGEDQ